jgi:hypothetical protein
VRTPTTLGPPHDGGLNDRHELRRRRDLETARREGWPRLERDDLTFMRYGVVEHRPTGALYQLHRSELVDALYASAAAYYVTESGAIVFLEAPPSWAPQTREELEQRQAEREQRRNAPKTRKRAAHR